MSHRLEEGYLQDKNIFTKHIWGAVSQAEGRDKAPKLRTYAEKSTIINSVWILPHVIGNLNFEGGFMLEYEETATTD